MAADLTYNQGVAQHRADGSIHVPTGKTIDLETGATIKFAGNAVTNNIKGRPYSATVVPASSTANVCLTTITVADETGTAIAFPHIMDIWLSDAATGAGLTATTASGAVAAGATGADFGVLTTKKALRVQTSTAGVYILSITDTAKTGFYVCANIPGGLTPAISAQLASSNYG